MAGDRLNILPRGEEEKRQEYAGFLLFALSDPLPDPLESRGVRDAEIEVLIERTLQDFIVEGEPIPQDAPVPRIAQQQQDPASGSHSGSCQLGKPAMMNFKFLRVSLIRMPFGPISSSWRLESKPDMRFFRIPTAFFSSMIEPL